MRERFCKNCGGRRYEVVGQNKVRCMFCGTLYVDDQASKEEEILLVSAYETLRDLKFDQALKEFEKVLTLYPLSFEAHFGKCLAKNKIVLYTNRRGARKYPRFFGNIVSIENDEDFKEAVKNAPPESVFEYNEVQKRIEKIFENYNKLDKTYGTDVVVCAMDFEKNNPDEKITETLNKLKESGLKTYFVNNLDKKDKEEETFFALSTSKAFVLFANAKTGYSQSEYKNLFDRYSYFIKQRKKYSKSFITVLDEKVLSQKELPDEVKFCKSFVDYNAESFLQDITLETIKEIKEGVQETAKIETVSVEKVTPDKKEYIDIDEAINPVELGHYKVENIETSEANQIRWIFLCLKNSDFTTANQVIEKGLEKDPNNAELLFAQLLCEKKIHTAGEFFQSVGNFSDKDKVDNILKYASKEFAEMIVDNWERLIIKLDSEEYYNAFLLYLAQYTSPMRDEFIKRAEEKAIQTQNEELIDKVLRCFKKEEVDRFVEFYFNLAQSSGKSEFYKKVLEIDIGHEQSNFAMLLSHFKNDEEKMSYRDREQIENGLKFLSEDTRVQFVKAVVNMVIPLAFLDTEEAQRQIDFYLGYISDKEKLVDVLKVIISSFEEMGFFKIAEKYISIAIIKTEERAEFYWMLIKAKAHCRTDAEIVSSSVDVALMPEWGTLLNLADENQTEKYAEIISKAHLYSGEKQPFREEMVDRKELKSKLTDFINRNNALLLGMQKENEKEYLKGINYYKLQLAPFESYLKSLDMVVNFDDYKLLFNRIFERLDLLDLSLESSISSIAVAEKSGGLKNVNDNAIERKIKTKVIKTKDLIEKREHWKFWRSFLFVLLEMIPSAFGVLFLGLICYNAKLVYEYFPQMFVFSLMLYNVVVGVVNLTVLLVLKKKIGVKWKTAYIFLISIAFANLALFFIAFYIFGDKITISSAKDLQIYTKNTTFCELVLDRDIDISEVKEWKLYDFNGKINGNGYAFTEIGKNIKGNQIAIFRKNNGVIKNTSFQFNTKTFSNVKTFAAIALENRGIIEGCEVYGNVTITTNIDSVVAGLVAKNYGTIKNSICITDFTITVSGKQTTFGGIVGEVKDNSTIEKDYAQNNIQVSLSSNGSIYMGGIAGLINDREDIIFERNSSEITFALDGSGKNVVAGGLAAVINVGSENNCSVGTITNTATASESGAIGGLFGEYVNGNWQEAILNHSYSNVTINNDVDGFKNGGLVGGKYGTVQNSYSSSNIDLVGGEKAGPTVMVPNNCENNVVGYKVKFGFDPKVWDTTDPTQFPTLK